MADPFFEHPILNSPYECPRRHWELDDQVQPTQQIIERRRRAEFITPIAEFTEVYQIEADFRDRVESEFNGMIEKLGGGNGQS